APLVKKLFVPRAAGAGLVEKPVRISALVSFKGEKTRLSDDDLRKLARKLVRRAVQRGGPHQALPEGELDAVGDALARTLQALGECGVTDAAAVQMGHRWLGDELYEQADGRRLTRDLGEDATRLYRDVLEAACLHIVHFFTQRSTFIARSLYEQSQQLADLITRTDLLIKRVPSRSAEDAGFEERYAGYIAKRHSHLTIYGIDLNQAREWPLDTAYLSLEATAKDRSLGGSPGGPHGDQGEWAATPPPPQPAEQALAGHERVLLRGVAGSGKTTLVQWLAVTTARQNRLTGRLAHLIGRVPFVLPLRTLTRRGAALPTPARFLEAVGCPLSGSQPQGWTDRVLSAGRGLVLVDGIDEVPEDERERTRRWLCDLLTAFPGNLWMVTSRPSAVREDWLGTDDFTELSLSRMSRDDIAVFINRWHEAAEADPELKLESALLTAVRTKPDLERLATNPLMCGLICALHRERRGFLPRGRKALYDAALNMLLERRDRERDMYGEGARELDEESQIELLQRLAYWLIRNGRSELDRADAIGLLERALPSMPYVAEQGTAEQIFRYLLDRSGLLREPANGAVDFVHRTFQDYLGAKAAVEERDFDLLASNAHKDQWEDVVRMAVAHARPDERARLLRALVARGDAEEEHRSRLHLLAMACLEHATKLDSAVRAEVERRAAVLIPPRDIFDTEELAVIGPAVLELLPGPEEMDDEEASIVVYTAARIGTDAGLATLLRFRNSEDLEVRAQLALHWSRFDTATYAREVIAHLIEGPPHVSITVRSPEELAALRDLGGHDRVELQGDFTEQQIAELLPAGEMRELSLDGNSVIGSLGFLTGYQRLESLQLTNCREISDLTPLRELPLANLTLQGLSSLKQLWGLRTLTRLRHLHLRQRLDWPGPSALPDGAPLEYVEAPPDLRDLHWMSNYPTLRDVGLWNAHPTVGFRDWTAFVHHPRLVTAALHDTHIAELVDTGARMERMEKMHFVLYHKGDLQQVVGLFPHLDHLTINHAQDVDLAPLARLPRLKTVALNRVTTVHNAEALPDSVELTVTPRPRPTPA
ncbi:NACHT domain-containing protein, partial [Streptomyces daliensis]|nr:NACHT domain-containing protein [Streptomyces daliensis]